MTGTALASLAAVAFFFAWMAAARVGFGAAALPPRAPGPGYHPRDKPSQAATRRADLS